MYLLCDNQFVLIFILFPWTGTTFFNIWIQPIIVVGIHSISLISLHPSGRNNTIHFYSLVMYLQCENQLFIFIVFDWIGARYDFDI